MARFFFVAGACGAGLAVILGALGAHWLKLERPDTWATAVWYHMSHALALLVLAWAWTQWGGPWLQAGGLLMIAGIVLFSGSMYVYELTNISAFGAVTPIGGLCLITGWVCVVLAAVR